MSTKAKQFPEVRASEPEVSYEIPEPRLIYYQLPNTIVVETDPTHVGGKLRAYLNGKGVMEANITHPGQNAYRLDEYLPAHEVYELQIGFYKAT